MDEIQLMEMVKQVRQMQREIDEIIPPETCNWKLIDEYWGTWESECGHQAMLNFGLGDPEESGYVYCPFCGRRLMQLPVPHED